MATRNTIHDVIEEFRLAPSNSQRGTKFEELMARWLAHDPTLSSEYDLIERWSDWSHRESSHDTGIDLVARHRHTGDWAAIQCKFYEPDHYLAKADIDSFLSASGRSWDGVTFANRIIISTTDRWSSNAEKTLVNQSVPVQRIGLADLADSRIDWMFHGGLDFEVKTAVKFGLRPHQKEAIAKIRSGFTEHDRGKWVSACGTGKTFTSLKLAEQLCKDNGGSLRVLFLAPSISLVAQSLREWLAQSPTDIRPFVVCSDTKAARQAEDITTHDIPLPTTDSARLSEGLASVGRRMRGMTVVFSTYQSIDVVAAAQRASGQPFDLILCDEAHRTTGVSLAGVDESAFTKVHDNEFLPGAKRLYMTATPRIFGTEVKTKADQASAVLTSMDDESVFGPEFHRLGFGEAVEEGLLTDYKVMVLVVPGDAIGERLQGSLATTDQELSLDDAAKIVGCWNGLAKRTTAHDFGPDPVPMQRAVAFCRDIKASKGFALAFPEVVELLHEGATGEPGSRAALAAVRHVDGTQNALQRGEALSWLKAPVPERETRVLSNARCLSEGVDVPALDAVLFLHPRNSLVDVVQSVGRVMRRAKDKDFGYVILPVALPAGLAPEEALRDNKRFKVVWDVLNALRSHDDRFNAMINSVEFDHDTGGKVIVDVIGSGEATDNEDGTPRETARDGVQLPLFDLSEWRDAILARIVKQCGDREYWDAWADDVVDINANQMARIKAILTHGDVPLRDTFTAFLEGLQANLNESITADDAVSMLSQHLITRPVFEALFAHDSFAAHNPVSQTMQTMVDALSDHGLRAETASLEKFYDSVRRRAAAIKTPAGRQSVIHELYEQFFKKAFPKQASSFGVVYTPVEIVDFILRCADEVCREQFGYGLTDEGVHVLDPFTGTGTFIVRLLESGIIRPEDLARKYASELWANEIMLLAYYIACVNIETTYQAIRLRAEGADPDEIEYAAFPGATLTDTFQITEDGDKADTSLIPVNNERIEAQLAAPIKVIVGNPPYSAGQSSANDNNANHKYPSLDGRIAETYAARSSATNKNSLYDSYIRAFRWATDRLGDQGVLAFVSNNGWVDGNTADGIRTTFAEDFSDVYVYNLRGNQRTAGELSRQEGGKVFGSGARTGVAVLVAVKNPERSGSMRLHYFGVPDCQTAEDKLAGLQASTLTSVPWLSLTANAAGDWLNQRNDAFASFAALANEPLAHFTSRSRGVETTRDAWCYNFSAAKVEHNMRRMIDFYNEQASLGLEAESDLDPDPTQISWSRNIKRRALKGRRAEYRPGGLRRAAMYRPFTKEALYFDPIFNSVPGQSASYFPTPAHENLGFCVVAPHPHAVPTVLMTDCVPDVATYTLTAQFFPRWTFEKAADDTLLASADSDVDEHGYRRVDNMTDGILAAYRERFGAQVTKDEIFFYVYGVLHSPQYRTTFAADLKRMLPRIPFAATRFDFEEFVRAGRELAELHIGYETVEPYPLHESTHPMGINDQDLYRVTKLKWKDKTTKDTIVYNAHLTLSDIPAEAHRYMLGSRSALEWIIDRYQVDPDKASGIVDDPNDWGLEHGDPRYIIDLIKRVTRVSVETMRIVDSLPGLDFSEADHERG